MTNVPSDTDPELTNISWPLEIPAERHAGLPLAVSKFLARHDPLKILRVGDSGVPGIAPPAVQEAFKEIARTAVITNNSLRGGPEYVKKMNDSAKLFKELSSQIVIGENRLMIPTEAITAQLTRVRDLHSVMRQRRSAAEEQFPNVSGGQQKFVPIWSADIVVLKSIMSFIFWAASPKEASWNKIVMDSFIEDLRSLLALLKDMIEDPEKVTFYIWLSTPAIRSRNPEANWDPFPQPEVGSDPWLLELGNEFDRQFVGHMLKEAFGDENIVFASTREMLALDHDETADRILASGASGIHVKRSRYPVVCLHLITDWLLYRQGLPELEDRTNPDGKLGKRAKDHATMACIKAATDAIDQEWVETLALIKRGIFPTKIDTVPGVGRVPGAFGGVNPWDKCTTLQEAYQQFLDLRDGNILRLLEEADWPAPLGATWQSLLTRQTNVGIGFGAQGNSRGGGPPAAGAQSGSG